jgi:peptidoglycan/LPS O-acetylase OafA/YrhL
VISGYLISAILVRQLGRSTFSIVEFYERRVRRIIPALFVVLLVPVELEVSK